MTTKSNATKNEPIAIQSAEGKLGILLVGMGAVATTTMAGILLARRGAAEGESSSEKALPIGSLTQLGTIRLGKRTDNRSPKISDLVPLTPLSKVELGGWDIFPDNAYEAAVRASVLSPKHLEQVREELSAITPMKGVFDQRFLPRLRGAHIKETKNKLDAVEQVRSDIRKFKADKGVDRVVVVWCGSTETFTSVSSIHDDIASFERGLEANDEAISPTQIQPSSLDLRIATRGYRVRSGFLPENVRVADRLEEMTLYAFDLTDGAVLEKGHCYIVPLL